MKIAVTGGSGQLGTVLLRRLLRDRGIKQVVSIDLEPPSLPGHKLAFVRADVRDPDIGRHFAGCDALVHLAFVVTEHRPRPEVDSINIDGSRNVFTAAAAAGVLQIIYSSSIAAYGVVPGHKLPLREDEPRIFQQNFAYSATKFQVEAFLDEFELKHPDLVITRLRPSILIGARMWHPMGRVLHQRIMLHAGETPMPIVWDEDVAEAIVLCLRKKARGAFNLCADELLPTKELARATGMHSLQVGKGAALVINKLSPLLQRLHIGRAQDPAWQESGNIDMTTSSARAREVLDWQPRYGTATEVMRHFNDVAPARLDPRLYTFFAAIGLAGKREPPRPEMLGLNERIHFQITGKGGGDLGLEIKDCRLHVSWKAPRPPTAVVTLSAELLLDLIRGRTDMGAAQLTGRVRVDGEPRALLLLGGILGAFRQAGHRRGVAGLLGRALQTWIGVTPGPHEEPSR